MRSVAVFAVVLAVYAWGCASTLQGGDASEFATVAAAGGVAHPPGYPLFSYWVRAVVHGLPGEALIWKSSLASAICAAGAVSVLHAALLRYARHDGVALVGAGVLAVHPVFWRYATVAEVFSLAALTAAGLIYVGVRVHEGWRGWRPQLALGLVVASGIANHHTVVLMAPLAVWAWYAALQKPARDTLVCAAAMSLGFLAYLPLMGIEGGWGDTSTVEGLIHHFLRRDYGTFSLAVAEHEVAWWAHPVAYLAELGPTFGWVFAALAALAIVRGARQRGLLLAIAAAWVVAGPLFMAKFNLPADWGNLVVARRFSITPAVLVAALAGMALPKDRKAWFFAPVVVVMGLLNGGDASHRGWTVLDDYVRNTFLVAEPNAVLLVASDNHLFAAQYLQRVEGVRPDVTVIAPPMLGYDWYREALPAPYDQVRNTDEALVAPDRPTYAAYAYYQGKWAAGRPLALPAPVVMLQVWNGPAPAPQELEVVMDHNMRSFTLNSGIERPEQWFTTWESWAVHQYIRGWNTLAGAYDRTGDPASAERVRQRAYALSPYVDASPGPEPGR